MRIPPEINLNTNYYRYNKKYFLPSQCYLLYLFTKNFFMRKSENQIEGVFIGIVESQEKKAAFNVFIETNRAKDDNPVINTLVDAYQRTVENNQRIIEKLAAQEEIILQTRCRENLKTIKIAVIREYIYARSPFYRRDKKAKDIRVIVDKAEFWNDDLVNDEEFMTKAKEKVLQAMDKEIEKTTLAYNLKHQEP